MSSCSRRSSVQSLIPVLKQRAEIVPQSGELDQPDLRRRELLGGDRSHLAAGQTAFVSFAQDDREFGERETKREGSSHEENAGERVLGIDPIVVG